MEERRVARPGGPEIAFRIGPPNGPPMLLLPGLGDPASSYAAVLPALLPRHHVHLMDYRGHAPSGRDPAGRYRVADHLGDVLDILGRMPDAPALVCGNSLGGVLAAAAAAARPDRVRGVVIEDGPLFLIEGETWRNSPIRTRGFALVASLLREREEGRLDREAYLADYARRPWTFGVRATHPERVRQLAALLRLLGDAWDRLPEGEQGDLAQGHARFLAEGEARWGEMLPRTFVEGSADRWAIADPLAVAAAADEDFSAGLPHAEVLRAIRCPILVLEADRDLVALLPAALMRRLIGSPGSGPAGHVLVEGALHDIHSSAPEAWLAAVDAFARRLAGEAGA